MSKKPFVPDAWDDDWETIADKQEPAVSAAQQVQPSQPAKKISKAERRAQQAELNRQLWQEAEAPKTFHFLESRPPVPLKSEFKPGITVLSRKPHQPKTHSPARNAMSNTTGGMENLSLNEASLSSDEEASPKPTMTVEERRLQTLREREEKQRKYDEARGRLFGTPDAGSGASSPGNVTPPRDQSASKNKGKGKATNMGSQDRAPPSAAGKGKDHGRGQQGQLFDPNYTAKPDSAYVQKREKKEEAKDKKGGKEDDKDEKGGDDEDEEEGLNHPIRQPRGPDGTKGFSSEFTSRLRGR